MGPKAFPLLMEDLHARPDEHALRFRFWRSTDRLLMSYFHLSVGSLGDVTTQDRIRWRAAQGLSALGPLARPALPELQRLLFTNFFHSSVKEAAFVLASIGPEGVNILTNAPNVDEWAGMCAIWALGQHPATGTNAIDFLVGASSSSSEGTACGAIQVLGLFHARPERVVPALVAALVSPSGAVRSDAARALGEFGQAADSAVIQLRALASDPSAGPAARAALDRIEAKKTR
jgi:HEAT repeat protein